MERPSYFKKNVRNTFKSKSDRASRTFTFIDESVAFIEQVAPPSSYKKVIDFGCGPGLYCERLAKKGYAVKGIDFSKNSIRYAEEQAKLQGLTIQYRCENYLHFNETNQYNLALLIYCDYGALSPTDRNVVLSNIWNSLKAGGQCLLDVSTLELFNQFEEKKSWDLFENGGFWSSAPYLALTRNVKYPNYVTLEQTTIITEQTHKTYNIWHQFFSTDFIVKEVESIGFKVRAIYDDVAGHTYTTSSATIALLLEK